jgi:MAE_28990/MAE_18760-like HEPN
MISQTRAEFDERVSEIETYLDLLVALEHETRNGHPKIGTHTVTTDQQKMLYSSLYLQLYNLVESTVVRCVGALAQEISRGSSLPEELSEPVRREWVRQIARTHIELSYDNRLKSALELCDLVSSRAPIDDLEIAKGGGGNWDDDEIGRLVERLGFDLRIPTAAFNQARRPIRDQMGAFKLVKYLRNQLAHGSISFVECGNGVVVEDLRILSKAVFQYLEGLIATFDTHILEQSFLGGAHRRVTVA